MNRPGIRFVFVLTAALVVMLVAGACGSTQPKAVGATTTPDATASATSASTSTHTPGSTASHRPSASSSASTKATAKAKATATATAKATATATATATADGTPGPSASGSGAIGCAGTGSDPTFFVTAARGLPFAVYCPVLPVTWTVITGQWLGGTEQWLQISYKGPHGAQISLQEGAFCTGGASLCTPHDSVIGQAAFGDLTGGLDALGPDPSFGYAIYIGAGTRQGYTITGTGLTQDAFTAIAAALIKVPKS